MSFNFPKLPLPRDIPAALLMLLCRIPQLGSASSPGAFQLLSRFNPFRVFHPQRRPFRSIRILCLYSPRASGSWKSDWVLHPGDPLSLVTLTPLSLRCRSSHQTPDIIVVSTRQTQLRNTHNSNYKLSSILDLLMLRHMHKAVRLELVKL